MRFTKMQGAGNDFIILEAREGAVPESTWSRLAADLCRRRISVGGDGLMVVLPPRRGGDYAMGFYNADGSPGEMCGNGARCIARYGYEHGLAGETQRIETTAGLVTARRIRSDQYQVRLNDPSVLRPGLTIPAEGRELRCTYVELGSPGIPHAVVCLEDWETWPEDRLRALGRSLRYNPVFPKGTNVTFWRPAEPGAVRAVTYERGVEDFTLACGTGAGSTAVALALEGRIDPDRLFLDFPGGRLEVSLTIEDGIRDILLTGPAVIVAEGECYP